MSKCCNVKFVSISNTVYADEQYGNKSFYEHIHKKIKRDVKFFLATKEISSQIERFSKRHNFNHQKVNHFLAIYYFSFFYRYRETLSLSQLMKFNSPTILLRSSPIDHYVRQEGEGIMENYSLKFSNLFSIKYRDKYYYDHHIGHSYFRSNRVFVIREIIKKLFSISHFLALKNSIPVSSDQKLIGIELVQARIRLSETNDLFFTNNNDEINDSDCCLIEHQDYTSQYKKDSFTQIESRNFHRLKIMNFKNIFIQICCGEINRDYKIRNLIILIGGRNFINNLGEYFKYSFLFTTGNNFLLFLLCKYKSDSLIWTRIYGESKISILWSMLDGGQHQMTKSQAVESNGGYYCGSHWSNYPLTQIINQKCYDILFSWSDFFSERLNKSFQSLQSYSVGYPSTDYLHLQSYTEQSSTIKNQYRENFIITFNDNVFFNDIAISQNHFDAFYSLALEILNENPKVIVFIKPKRAKLFTKHLSKNKEMNDYIESGRVRIFLGDIERSKVPPGFLAMASDLVVGLGLSSTTTESIIVGTLSYNIELCGFRQNQFFNQGLNNVVFNNIPSAKQAINNVIRDDTTDHFVSAKKYYKILDPFLDLDCGKRVAKKMRELLNSQMNVVKTKS